MVHVRGTLDVKGTRITFRFAHFREEQTNGTDGQALTQGSWTTRTLNTQVSNMLPGCVLSSNKITLPAGSYYVEATAQAYQCQQAKLRLQDVTNGVTLAAGQNVYSEVVAFGGLDQTMCTMHGIFDIESTIEVELQQRVVDSDSVSNEGGESVDSGENEVYAEIIISNY